MKFDLFSYLIQGIKDRNIEADFDLSDIKEKINESETAKMGLTIVFVDDVEDNLSQIEIDAPDHWNLVKFTDSTEAFKFIDQNRFQIAGVVSDQVMPNSEMQGLELLEATRVIPGNGYARILITGYSDENVYLDLINKIKIDHFIKKPVNNEELINIVENHVFNYLLKHWIEEWEISLFPSVFDEDNENESDDSEKIDLEKKFSIMDFLEEMNFKHKFVDSMYSFDKHLKFVEKELCVVYIDDVKENLSQMEVDAPNYWNLKTFPTGEEACQFIDENKEKISLILTDQVLDAGKMQGEDILRKYNLVPRLPMLMISGYANHEVKIEIINNLDVDYFFKKPVSFENIKEMIEKFIAQNIIEKIDFSRRRFSYAS